MISESALVTCPQISLGDHSVMTCLAAQAQHAAAATKLRETSPPVPAAMRWYRMPARVERERVEREWRESGYPGRPRKVGPMIDFLLWS